MTQNEQYIRHSILPEIGEEGQTKLSKSCVGVIGAGGLGSPVIQYLTSFGIGKIIIIDDDEVEKTNLNRQVIHNTTTIGIPKAESAKKAAELLNPTITIISHVIRLDETNGKELLKECNLLMDCCDNHTTRYVISKLGVELGIPIVTGSVVRWEGHVTVLNYKGGPCYKCLYPEMPSQTLNATAKSVGVVGPICGVIGSVQTLEAVKILLDKGEILNGKMFMYNGLTLMSKIIRSKQRNTSCEVCSSFHEN